MELEITTKEEKPLLKQTEVVATIRFTGATPSKREVVAALAAALKAKQELVIVRAIETRYGEQSARVHAFRYQDRESLELVERPSMVKKNTFEAAKAAEEDSEAGSKEAPEKAAEAESKGGEKAEAPEEKAESDKKEQEDAAETKTEKKAAEKESEAPDEKTETPEEKADAEKPAEADATAEEKAEKKEGDA